MPANKNLRFLSVTVSSQAAIAKKVAIHNKYRKSKWYRLERNGDQYTSSNTIRKDVTKTTNAQEYSLRFFNREATGFANSLQTSNKTG